MTFNREAYDIFLVKNSVVGFYEDPITLRSGGLSFWYANFRALLDDLNKVDKAAEFIYDFVRQNNLNPTNFFAVPEGPREFASSANRILREHYTGKVISATSLRAGYKTHGSPLDRYSVGPLFPLMNPILIEDVSTTGNSSTEFIMNLQEQGISPLALLSMLNRLERRNDGRTVKELVEGSYNVKYLPMSGADTVLPIAIRLLEPKESILEGLRKEVSDRERYIVEISI